MLDGMARARIPLPTLASAPLVAVALASLTACPGDDGEGSSGNDEVAATDETTETAGDETGEDGGGPEPCAAQTPAEVLDCVDAEAYTADLEFIADLRVPGSTHWQAVQELCVDRLTELGFSVELHDYGTGVNVLGTLPGDDPTLANEAVIIGAHYDHIPECTGADDNATGVAAVLELARVFSTVETPRPLVVACWDEEELGLIGSDAHAQRTLDEGQVVTAAFAYDMIGFTDDSPNSQSVPEGFDLLFPAEYATLEANEFRADFLFWVSDEATEALGEALDGFAETRGIPTIGAPLTDALKTSPLLADLRRSDHASFWDRDLPAMFLNDTADFRYPSYHCFDGGDDSIAKLDVEFAVDVSAATAGTVAQALGL